jgi:DNA-binding MarR family transcriptional regulator
VSADPKPLDPRQSPWFDPGPAGERLGVEDFPTFIVGHLASTLQREITGGYLDAFDLPAPQWRVLAALAAYAPMSLSELVKLSMSDKALVSRTVQTLVERGLAQVDADPDHGKKIVCRITAKGRALYQRVLPKAREAQARVLALLEPQERAVLHATLVKLRKALIRP